jgi:hypothetical protein
MKVLCISIVAALSLGLGGCTNAPSEPQGSTFTGEGFVAVAPLGLFAEVAKASCDKAMAEGVVEKSTVVDGFTLVMVPKDQGYQDFSAAFFAQPDDYQLIYEVDAFSACSAAIAFSLAGESGGEVDMQVETDINSGTFVTTQDLGEFGISKLEYQTKDGLFVGVKTLGESNADPRSITYGYSEQDLQILITAVDRFLTTEQ